MNVMEIMARDMSQIISLAQANLKFVPIVVNVQGFGAVGDGVHDDTAAFNAAVAYLHPTGGTLYIPAGTYKISSVIDIDLSNDTPQASGKGISIRGDNINTTTLINNSNNNYVFYVHSTGATEAGNAHFHAEHFTITKAGSATTTGGIKMSGFSQSSLQNIFFFQLGDKSGLYMEDIVTCNLINCRFSQNTYGLTAAGQVTFSAPNAIDLHSCVFYGNGRYAAYFNGGCNVNFFGGTVETSGGDSSTGLRWGVKLDGFGRYGAAGAIFHGVYFEANQNVADVWINHTDYAATYTFIGCTFNRFAAPQFSEHNIRVDAGSSVALTVACLVNVIGCGFRDFPGYTVSASRPYIKFYSGGTPCTLEQYGNHWNSPVETPTIASNRLFSMGRFIGLSGTPSIFKAFNVATIARNGTGDYTITFIKPSVNNEKITTIGMDIIGFSQVTAETNATLRIKTYNTSGAAVDPGQLSFHSYE